MSEIDIGETIKNNIDYWKNLYFEEREKRNDVEEKLKITVAIITRGMYPEKNEGDNDFDKQFIAVDKIKEKIEYQNMLWNTPNRQKEYNQEVVEVLEELLEEK